MTTGRPSKPEAAASLEGLRRRTLRACEVAGAAAAAARAALAGNSDRHVEEVRQHEEELDTLDRQVNEDITAAISGVPAAEARELLACLKIVIELERVGDLLLNFANRVVSVAPRLGEDDVRDLASMAFILERMIADACKAFSDRDLDRARAVLRADSELDRLRNLLFVRHIENRERTQRTESFHVVFMSQTVERAGDHTKNIAEEVVHLVTGRSVRHLLRSADKPDEVRWMETIRRKGAKR